MKMQSALTRQLASRFSAPKNVISPNEVQEYKAIIEKWVAEFPPEYAFENPDTSKDQRCSWLFAHRFYVYTMACLLILNPIRHYMVKQYSWESPADELNIRTVGVWYSLKLMKTLRQWVDKIYNRDGRLHFIIFSIFDTAAILCTAILKDSGHTITNKPDVLAAIGDAVDMLKKLNTISKTAKTSYNILERLVRRLPEAVPRNDLEHQVKRTKVHITAPPPAPSQEAVHLMSQISAPVAAPPPTTAPIQPHLAEGIHDSPMPSTSSTHPMLAPVTAPTMAPHYANYHSTNSDFSHQVIPQNVNYMTMNNHGAPAQSSSHQMVLEPHGPREWSTSSENTPPRTNEHSVPSLAAQNEFVGLDDGIYEQPAVETGPEFNIENLTAAQMGELAPLWSWHSGNLDFANMPPPTAGPNGYPRRI
jgi:hypothetical protein